MLAVLTLSITLALDAAAVSASMGASGVGRTWLLRMALLFGAFQGGMAALGAYGGLWMVNYLGGWEHWIAFGLLAVVGCQMIFSGASDDSEEVEASWPVLLGLAVATSIDALAAGVTLPLFEVTVLRSVVAIGVVTVALSLLAGGLSAVAGGWLGPWAEKVGGLVLIALGLRIVLIH